MDRSMSQSGREKWAECVYWAKTLGLGQRMPGAQALVFIRNSPSHHLPPSDMSGFGSRVAGPFSFHWMELVMG